MRIENPTRGTQPLRANPAETPNDPGLRAGVPPASPPDLAALGASALASLLAAALPGASIVARGLFDLLSAGALQPSTAAQLERDVKTPDELLEGALRLMPLMGPLGPAAAAVLGTVVSLLEDARSLKDLLESPTQQRKIAERLPAQLAEALAPGWPPPFRAALAEFLSTGALTPRTFEKLGASQVASLFELLAARFDDLSRLLPDGASWLAEGVQAGRAASAAGPATFGAFQQTYEQNLPPTTRAYLRGTSTFSATGEIAENGLSGRGRLAWQGELEGRVDADFGLPGGQGSAYAEGRASAFVGAKGEFQLDGKGLQASGTLGAAATVEAGAGLRMEQSTLGGALATTSELEGRVKAEAAAKVDVDAMVGFDEQGNFQAYANVDARMMAELEAEARAQNTLNIFGFKVTTAAFVKAQASAGAEASGGIGYRDGKFYAAGAAGLGVGVGVEVGRAISVELPEWAQQGLNAFMGFMGRLGNSEGTEARS